MKPLVPAHIREHWDQIKEAVADILRGEDERPEDIYAAVLFREAHLYLNDEGFAVLRKSLNPYTRKHELMVWLVHAFKHGVELDFYYDELLRLARESDCVRVVFNSKRKGWERVLKAPKWSKAMTTFQMEVPHG